MTLLNKLKYLHAVEFGAYHAYEGHKNTSNYEKYLKILVIQSDEVVHRLRLHLFIGQLGGKPSKSLNILFWLIGKTISGLCYIMPTWAADKGAAFMERMAMYDYNTVAKQALDLGHDEMFHELMRMARSELSHKKFFEGDNEAV